MDLTELSELVNEGKMTPDFCDPCTTARRGSTKPSITRPAFMRKGAEIILVEDEVTNTVTYMRRGPDGHLGAVED